MAITFDSIGNGELAAMFRAALFQIGANLMDPNMDPEAARGMTITLKFKPNGTGAINAEYDIKTKLAGQKKSKTTLLIGQDARTGRIEISEYGNNRAQVAAYETIPTEPRSEPAGQQAKEFDPETGEIYYSTGKPIDLRQQARQ